MEPLVEMEQRLLQEGLSMEASSSERLAVLWRLYVEKDNSARALAQEVLKLRAERGAEIDTVLQYVENIRSLSKARDLVALGLEHENEMLLNKLDEIKVLQEAQRDEIAEMLLQEDLTEVISYSPSEQVAYLLAERASLLEKRPGLDGGDIKMLHPNTSQKAAALQSPKENPDKTASLQGQSSWRRLIRFRKEPQAKPIFPPVGGQSGEENPSKERHCQLLERDVAEATSRLDMAHKEIRRLTNELESAHLTLRAHEPELQAAQQEVEQLRQEVDSVKCHDAAQLQKAKETNELLEAEVHHLKDTVQRLHTEQLQSLELTEDSDSEEDDVLEAFTQKLIKGPNLSRNSLSKRKRKKEEKDLHKRCREELEEKLHSLEDLKQVVENLQAELAEETLQRKKVEEECEEQRKRREEAEDLTTQLQELQEQKDSDHEAEVQRFQEEIKLLETIDELNVEKEQRKDRECMQYLELLGALDAELSRVKSALLTEKEQTGRQQLLDEQTQTDEGKALTQAQDVQLQDCRTQCERLNEELQSAQHLSTNSQEQLLLQNESTSQLQSNSIPFLEQEKPKEGAELVEVQAQGKQLENEASQFPELQSLQTCQTLCVQDQSPLEQEQEKVCFRSAQAHSVEEEDLKQVVENLQAELAEETLQRKKVEEECEEQRKRREEAEDLTMQLQELQEQKDSDHEAEVQRFQEEIKLLETIDELSVENEQRKDRECMQHLELIQHLQNLLTKTTQQLHAEESHRAQSIRLEQQVKDMVAEMSMLKEQTQNSQQQRKLLAEREEEMQQQLHSLLASNCQLSLDKADLSRQVQDLQNEEINKFRQDIKNLKEELTFSQQDCEKLRTQLQQANANLSFQISKNRDKKVRHKERLGKAKEVFLRETAQRDERIEEQERELRILAKRLDRESGMVKKVYAENEALLLNKKDLLCRLNEEEEARLQAAAAVSSLQHRLDLLEKDNIYQRDTNMMKNTHIKNLERQLLDIQSLTVSE